MDKNSLQKEIITFIEKEIFFSKKKIKKDETLLSNGSLDSVAHLRLIQFLEKKYKIQVSLEDFDPDNFDSVEKIAAFTEKKLA